MLHISLTSDQMEDLFLGVHLFRSVESRADPLLHLETKADEDMAFYRNVGKFNTSIEEWTAYIEQLDHYFVANDVADGAKT